MISIHVRSNPDDLAAAAAEYISTLAIDAIHTRGSCAIALPGGSTPRLTYEKLRTTRSGLDWSRMALYWSDERCVPPDHPDSNFRLAHEALLAHVRVPASSIHRMDCSASPQAGAEAYENLLRSRLEVCGEPAIDLVMLGLGSDGHTASLFPGTAALRESKRWVTANWVDSLESWRMTLTYPALRAAGRILFLVQGSDKAAAVQAILGNHDLTLPATTVITHAANVVWFLDAAAAAKLDPGYGGGEPKA